MGSSQPRKHCVKGTIDSVEYVATFLTKTADVFEFFNRTAHIVIATATVRIVVDIQVPGVVPSLAHFRWELSNL